MAIEFTFNGEVWRADTPEEAIALRSKLEWAPRYPADPHLAMEEADKFWTPDRFMDVINGIGRLQHLLLASICWKPGASSSELVQWLGLDSEVALAGVISGLSKQLKQVAVEPKQVFLITVKWAGKKKNRTFLLDDFFQGAASDQNWPDAWEDKLKELSTLKDEIKMT
jgi:hypothetical protein